MLMLVRDCLGEIGNAQILHQALEAAEEVAYPTDPLRRAWEAEAEVEEEEAHQEPCRASAVAVVVEGQHPWAPAHPVSFRAMVEAVAEEVRLK